MIFESREEEYYWAGAAVGFVIGILITLFNLWIWGFL